MAAAAADAFGARVAATRYVSFGSAGFKGAVYTGFLSALEDHFCRGPGGAEAYAAWRSQLLGVAGTSSGALAALALALGLERSTRTAALREFSDMRRILPSVDIARLYRNHGADDGQGLRACVAHLLTAGGLSPTSTLGDVRRLLRLDFVCFATELQSSTAVALSAATAPDMRVCDAIYASCCLPFAFVPLRRGDGAVLVDGCMLARLPDPFPDGARTLYVDVTLTEACEGGIGSWPGFLRALLATTATLQAPAVRQLQGPTVVIDSPVLRQTECFDLSLTPTTPPRLPRAGGTGSDVLASGALSATLGGMCTLCAEHRVARAAPAARGAGLAAAAAGRDPQRRSGSGPRPSTPCTTTARPCPAPRLAPRVPHPGQYGLEVEQHDGGGHQCTDGRHRVALGLQLPVQGQLLQQLPEQLRWPAAARVPRGRCRGDRRRRRRGSGATAGVALHGTGRGGGLRPSGGAAAPAHASASGVAIFGFPPLLALPP